MTDVQIATEIAFRLYGTPYIWAGNDPTPGVDCSGFACLILHETGKLQLGKDMTASMLWDFFKDQRLKVCGEGCLVFYGKTTPTHVMYCLNGRLCIGAAGGDSKCINPKDALQRDARIKVLPINYRTDIIGYVNPFMATQDENGFYV